jgi:uncharacterized membrane protein YdfJ with MMPL/SSD domain
VIIDATLVRLILLPAAVRFAGDWAWWTPAMDYEVEYLPEEPGAPAPQSA